MIAKSATNKDSCTTGAVFTNSARSAWGHIIRSLSEQGRQSVLLPAYIGFTEREGSGVFDPVAAHGAAYEFYRLNDDLSVDLDDFRSKLANATIALVIHYFGFCRSDLLAMRHLCDAAGVIMVEDCAHAFQLETAMPALGCTGDFAFYSLHKYIATDSGGILVANRGARALAPLPPSERAAYEVLEQYARTDFEAIRSVRRANYALYQSLLESLRDVHVLYALEAADVPQTCAVRIKNGRREALYFYLMERAMPTTALYYRMIDQLDPARFATSFAVAGEILNLPVHQDTSADDVRALCAEMTAFFNAC